MAKRTDPHSKLTQAEEIRKLIQDSEEKVREFFRSQDCYAQRVVKRVQPKQKKPTSPPVQEG